MKSNEQTSAIKADIEKVLTKGTDEDQAIALLDLAFAKLGAIGTKAQVSDEMRQEMKQDIPEMEDGDIDTYALEGNDAAFVASVVASRLGMYLDHQPDLREPTRRSLADQRKGDVIQDLGMEIDKACDRAIKAGLTPEGVFSVIAVSSLPIRMMGDNGVGPLYATRWLCHAISKAGQHDGKGTRPMTDDEIAEALAQQLGVSITTARKYMREHR